jgi:hypothetical protein
MFVRGQMKLLDYHCFTCVWLFHCPRNVLPGLGHSPRNGLTGYVNIPEMVWMAFSPSQKWSVWLYHSLRNYVTGCVSPRHLFVSLWLYGCITTTWCDWLCHSPTHRYGMTVCVAVSGMVWLVVPQSHTWWTGCVAVTACNIVPEMVWLIVSLSQKLSDWLYHCTTNGLIGSVKVPYEKSQTWSDWLCQCPQNGWLIMLQF